MMQFDFGQNWEAFSKNALTADKVAQAKKDFVDLFDGISLKDKNFLDIGFGQGLSSLIAQELGAKVYSVDINAKCTEALRETQTFFPNQQRSPNLNIGSILNPDLLNRLAQTEFDVVYSWGVLHHTGDMEQSIQNAASLVKDGGHLVMALYNKHWTSQPWLWIKWLYSQSPSFMKRILIYSLYPVIWVAKFFATKQNPIKMDRGMDFFYNVVDWVGGYPYEYASKEEVIQKMKAKGFSCLRFCPAQVPTGCNEFIFQKNVEV